MKRNWRTWPLRFVRWLCGSPFRGLPRAFGDPTPADLRRFKAQADEAAQHGLGGVAAPVPVAHARTRPARVDPALERQ